LADPFTNKVQALVVSNIGNRVVGINETTRLAIARIIEQLLGVGDETRTISDIAGAVEDLGTFDAARAEMIARTETAFAFNTAALTSYDQYGVKQVQAIDGDHDEVCAERNGKVYPVAEAMDIEDHPNGTLDWVPL
jgi:SPP1 gp7 family putative phage head morphogenesis protein